MSCVEERVLSMSMSGCVADGWLLAVLWHVTMVVSRLHLVKFSYYSSLSFP